MSSSTPDLPLPRLVGGRFVAGAAVSDDADGLPLHTDPDLFDAVGVRIAFTGRAGGCSAPPYDGLNLGDHVGDDPAAVAANRSMLLDALGATGAPLSVPRQVHGTDIARPADNAAQDADIEADGVLCDRPGSAVLLCYADCLSVIIVAPDASFVVAHAGWRGALGRIAGRAVAALAEHGGDASRFNAYIGPYIHGECFEVSTEIADSFRDEFGGDVLVDGRHVDLGAAVRRQLEDAGVVARRIVDMDVCTACSSDRYFSYRRSGGTCGRHGACAVGPMNG